MRHKVSSRFVLLLLASLLFSFPGFAEEVRIAVRAHNGEERAITKWQATIDYLNKKIPEHHFTLVPVVSLTELTRTAGNQEFEFVLTNPSSYVEINHFHRGERILTLHNKFKNQALSSFGAVVFTRSDRRDLNAFDDLKGKTLLAVSPEAFGGWRVAWHEMLHYHQLDPFKQLALISYTDGLQSKVVEKVLNGEFDAGVVRTNMLERLAAAKKINLHEIKLINTQKVSGFPYLLSTQLYPEWPLVKLPHTSSQLANQVAIALLSLKPDHPAAVKGNYYGWGVPQDYHAVRHLLEELQIEPFTKDEQYSLGHIILHYWHWFVGLLVLLVSIFIFSIYMAQLNRRLRNTRRRLEENRQLLEQRVVERTTKLDKTIRLMDCVNIAQSAFIDEQSGQNAFNLILESLLQLAESEYGFIADVLYNENNLPYLRSRALTNIAWNEETQIFYAENAEQGMVFTNLNTLFGHVIVSGDTIISNDPANDDRAAGLPEGHPPLNAFLGIPVYFKNQLYGVVGLANRHDGYDEQLAEYISPIITTVANMLDAVRVREQIEHTRRELQLSNTKLEQLLTSSPNIIYALDINNNFAPSFVSDNISNLFGYTPQECLTYPDWWKSHVHPADLEKAIQTSYTLFDNGVIQHDYRFRMKDGSYRWIHDELKLIYNTDGQAEHAVGSWYDITERRAAQQIVLQTANALKRLHSITTESGLSHTERFNRLLQLGLEIFQMDIAIISRVEGNDYTVEYIQGTGDLPVAGSRFDFQQTYCFHTYQADGATGFHHVGQSRIKNHSCYQHTAMEAYLGAPVYVSGKRYGTLSFSSPQPHDRAFTDNEYSLIQLLAQWVGGEIERQQNESTIRQNNYMLQAILDTIPVTVFWKDVNGCYMGCNKLFANITGLGNQEDIIGKTDYDMPWHDHAELYQGDDQSVMLTKTPKLAYEEPFPNDDGSTTWLETSKIPLIDSDGHAYGVLGSFYDITERKRIDQIKNEFISTVSHEIRTPLTSIRGALSLLNTSIRKDLDADNQQLLHIAANNTERLLLLINDILDIQKIESGKINFHFETLQLMPLIEKAIADNQGYAEQYKVSYIIRQRIDDAKVFVDSHRFIQIMNNLLSNAAKFSPPGDAITINVSRHHDALRISVTDNGEGIPDEFKDRIFQKFTQLDASDSRQKGGTGLGLSIAQSLVERHGGRIDFVSHQGSGTTFFFELPEIRETLALTSTRPSQLEEHRKCLLIVEDDPHVAAILQRILAENGYLSDVAHTAQRARELIARNGRHYRAITLDLMLPDEDGINLFNDLRHHDETAHIPVIVISAKADQAKREINGGAVGIIDWLQKPLDMKRLRGCLEDILSQPDRPHILHIEDDESIHFTVKKLLDDHAQVSLARDGEDARHKLQEHCYDLVLLDISLGDCSGFDLLDDIRANHCTPPVVVFSAHAVSHEDAARVDEVLMKSSTTNDELLDIISSHLRPSTHQ